MHCSRRKRQTSRAGQIAVGLYTVLCQTADGQFFSHRVQVQ
jgi:hypothetical protein